jgi:serine/threonine-protein kinase
VNDALLTPRKALGRYEILGEIARGAMGVVYKARDPLIDRLVAIKTVTLGPSDAETEAFERRFFREAKSAGRLNHPNVVIIHDVGKTEDVAYIAMEFLDGRSLREILDSGVVLPPQRIADISAEIAEGLAFAHRNQVVHRDVKPANIMVLASGAVKITDFGIALLPTGTRTLSTNAFGSPRYTSPEQVMGQDDRRQVRHFFAGCRGVRDAHRTLAVRRRRSQQHPAPGAERSHAAAVEPQPQAAARVRSHRRQGARKGSCRPLPERAGDGRGAPPLRFDRVRNVRARAASGARARDRAARLAVARDGRRTSTRGSRRDLDDACMVEGTARHDRRRGVRRGHRDHRRGCDAQALPDRATIAEMARGTTSGAIPSAPVTVPAPTPVDAKPPLPAPAIAPATAEPAAPQAAAPAIAAVPAVVAAAADRSATPPVAPPAAPKPTGRVVMAVTPWGEVIVDGRKRGLSPPLTELRLAPGSHVVEIRNSTFAPYRETIDVTADGSVRIKHKFE